MNFRMQFAATVWSARLQHQGRAENVSARFLYSNRAWTASLNSATTNFSSADASRC